MANAAVTRGLISVGLAGALCVLAAQASGDSFVVPGSKAAGQESCVEPTDFMRRNHMEVIKHQRDETVHGGIRSTKHSLAGCIECHASYGEDGAPVPVDEKAQFCSACHAFTAVSLNCFDCHATVPDAGGRPAMSAAGSTRFAWHPSLAGVGAQAQTPQSAAEGEDTP